MMKTRSSRNRLTLIPPVLLFIAVLIAGYDQTDPPVNPNRALAPVERVEALEQSHQDDKAPRTPTGATDAEPAASPANEDPSHRAPLQDPDEETTRMFYASTATISADFAATAGRCS